MTKHQIAEVMTVREASLLGVKAQKKIYGEGYNAEMRRRNLTQIKRAGGLKKYKELCAARMRHYWAEKRKKLSPTGEK